MDRLVNISFNLLIIVSSIDCATLQKAYSDRQGRHLLIRRVPAVEEFQSDIYEVFAKPYNYDLHQITAIAVLKNDEVSGEITFTQLPAGPVHIKGNITGLPLGKHGFHIHHSGDLRSGCEKLGSHFNPYFVQHGGPLDPLRHVGDIGNVEAGNDGTVEVNIIDNLVQLTGYPRGVVGRAVVITSDPDDYGRGGDANSLVDGNSGKPIVCGVIAYIK
ncbi:superoxide dismutase [Cu-Zn]-like [Harmonia axyridis]|uniref:superoxide dismutase [Cu-Zn]-like n=1 Tax=Harmonia axyridis TaxID=115357 RepID=UPI001E276114|nr:superoxide dismutase [Cu-Zn]-like [Harmonia axyridis]